MPLPLLDWLERTGLSASDTGPRPVLSDFQHVHIATASGRTRSCGCRTCGHQMCRHDQRFACRRRALGSARSAACRGGRAGQVALSTAEINAVMAATGMTVQTSRQNMWDDSPGVADMNCLAVDGPAEDKIYTGCAWTAMRAQVLQEPGDAWTHYVLQSVVAFPSVADAAAFFTASSKSWRACSNRRFTYTRPGPDPVWTTAQISNAAGTLAISMVRDSLKHWTCQHALTVANKVAVDVQACGYNQTDPAAVTIASQIAAKLADR